MEPLAADDPHQVGGYRLHARLGAGGMGQVFLGFSPAGRAVAVKVIHRQFARDPEFVRRFGREVEAASAVSGAYTAPVVAAGPGDDPPWLATVFVPGPSLAEVIAQAGPLPEPAVWRLAGGLIEALQAVHAGGLVHRDLKPANVLLAADGPRLIDFGISRALEGAAMSVTSLIVGTPAFMSPEQAEGLPVGPASDVFALGSVIAFAATGAAPFGAGPSSPIVVAYRVVHAQPDLSHVPVPLTNLVAACLVKNPADRPQLAQLMDAVRDGSAPYQAGWPGSYWPEPVAGMVSSRQDSFQPPSRGKLLRTTVQLGVQRRLHLRWPAQARWRVLTLVVVAAVLLAAGAISIALIRSSPAPAAAGPAPTPAAIRAAAAAHTAAARWIAAQVSTDAIVSCDPRMCALLEAHGIPAGRLLPLGGGNPAPLGSDLIVSTAAVRSEFGGRLSSVYAPVVLASFGTGSAQTAVRVVAADGAAAYMHSLRTDLAARAFAGSQLLQNPRLHASGPARRALAAGQVDSRLLTAFAALATMHVVDVVDFPAAASGASPGLPLRAADIAAAGPAIRHRPTTVASLARFLRNQLAPFRPASITIVRLASGRPVLRVEYGAPSPFGLLGKG
jgi:protein kinase-like protein